MIGMRSRRSLLPLVLGFLLLLIAASAAAFLSIRRDDATRQVLQTLEIDGQLHRIQTLVTDAETGQRGFLLTGRLTYLDPYVAAHRELGAALERLAGATVANPVQRRAIADLKTEIATKLAELQQTIDLRVANRPDAALAVINNDSGKETMARIRTILADMSEEERRLFEQRSARAASLNEFGQWAVIGSALLVVILGGLTLYDGRRRLMELQASNLQLAKEVGERRAAESQVLQMQKMEAVGQLTGGIAHDFNNMLAIIVGSLEMARRRLAGTEHPGVARFIDNADEGARRAAALTTRLLAFSRRQALEPRVLDLNALVGGMSEMLRRTIGETIHIETVLSGGLWRVFADPAQVESTLVNLVVNARDSMADGGKLTIETGNADLDERYARAHAEVTPGQYTMISVTDTGIGMTPEVMGQAFDPFFTTKPPGKGTGLGLSQVLGFVKQSNGHVKIYSEVGRGTTVKVYLPRFTGEGPTAVPVDEGVQSPLGQREELILVVEDDAGVRNLSVEALRELGYSVIHTGSPGEALREIERRPEITLLFTDIVMPEMTGRDLAEKAQALRPGLKVLYTTGYTRNAVVHNGIVDIGTAFLPKPFIIDHLAFKVRQTIDSK
jgi:signal transduction histidine kinase/ActR/RegA family two-component response regulator